MSKDYLNPGKTDDPVSHLSTIQPVIKSVIQPVIKPVYLKYQEEEQAQKAANQFKNPADLGKYLSQYAAHNDPYVLAVLQKKWFWETDDIALHLLKNLSDAQLGNCSKPLLQYLSTSLTNGWTTDEEKTQVERINFILANPVEKKTAEVKPAGKNLKLSVVVLKEIFPKAKSEHLKNIVEEITKNGKTYGIDTYDKLAHYLAQAGHETGGFAQNATVESGYYPSEERVKEVFGEKSYTYKQTQENPDDYLKNSKKFLNMAYANLNGNGDEASGDGYKYRGRGYFQLTGKENYANFSAFSKSKLNRKDNFVSNPELVGNNNKHAIASSLWYFKTRTLKAINENKSFKLITKTINAGAVDVETREEIYNKAKRVFNKYYK